MVGGVSEKRGPVDARFIRRMPRTKLTGPDRIRSEQSALYIGQSIGNNRLLRCRTIEEYEALVREALTYLVSENDAFGTRQPNFPPKRIHFFFKARKLEDGLPFELMDIVQAALRSNRLIYIGDTAFGEGEADPEIRSRRRVVFSITEDLVPRRTPLGIIAKDLVIERGFPEALGLSRDQVPVRLRLANGEIQESPSLLILPFVSISGRIDEMTKEGIGGAVVVGTKPEFLNPRVDLEPVRLLGLKASLNFRVQPLSK